jgi:hypothetical protein
MPGDLVTTLTVAFADHLHAELAVTFPRDAAEVMNR